MNVTLFLLLIAYLIYLFLPIPAMEGLNPHRLHSRKKWAPGDLQVIKEYDAPTQADLWLVGSSVASSLFPSKKLDSHFGKTQTNTFHLTFIKLQHLNAIFGEKGLLKPPPAFVFLVSPDLLINFSRFEDLDSFSFLRRNRALSWRLSAYNMMTGSKYFIVNDDAMSHSLDEVKNKKDLQLIEDNSIAFIKQSRDNDHTDQLFEKELAYFKEFSDYLRKNSSQLMVIILPVQKIFFEYQSPLVNNIKSFQNTCATNNIPFLDLSKEPVDPKAFIDWGHFSPSSEKLNPVRKKIAGWILSR